MGRGGKTIENRGDPPSPTPHPHVWYKLCEQMRGRGLLIEPQYLITTIKKSVYIAIGEGDQMFPKFFLRGLNLWFLLTRE